MKYPCLVPEAWCRIPIKIKLHREGLTEDGGPVPETEIDEMCNYQDTAKTVLTADKKLIQLSGTALLPGDICPDLPSLSGGIVVIHGAERVIFQGRKARNPDGTVNYTELRLI